MGSYHDELREDSLPGTWEWTLTSAGFGQAFLYVTIGEDRLALVVELTTTAMIREVVRPQLWIALSIPLSNTIVSHSSLSLDGQKIKSKDRRKHHDEARGDSTKKQLIKSWPAFPVHHRPDLLTSCSSKYKR